MLFEIHVKQRLSGRNSILEILKQHRSCLETDRFENGHSLLAEPDGVKDIVVEDGLKKVVFIVGLKRWLSRHHFIHEYAQSPPVH